MRRIAFFGASITQQKTGYVHWFKNLNPDLDIYQYGYGSMYIHDAGICYIDEVIKNNPQFCFLDWFSPACYRPPEKIKDYLDAIIQKLFSIKCRPIFLFFYRKNMDNGWFTMFDYLKNYANMYCINFIDLSRIKNADDCLRDTIHTNEYGAQVYGDIINSQFHNMNFIENNKIIQQNKYSNIKCLEINQTYKHILTIHSNNESSIVGILQDIGPYTQDIDCIYNDKKVTIPVKDQWSEKYERETMKITVDKFYHALCFKIPEGSKLVIKKIFYIGDEIALI